MHKVIRFSNQRKHAAATLQKLLLIEPKLSLSLGRQLLSDHELQTMQNAIHHVKGLFIA